MVLAAIAILAVFVAELIENTIHRLSRSRSPSATGSRPSTSRKSGINLTRLLIAREPQIRQVVAPIYS